MVSQCRSDGFTLIEILMVLALLGLIATMLPQGLNSLYSRTKHQALVQETLVAARSCFIVSQRQRRSVRLGSTSCPLPVSLRESQETQLMPVFHADGTASHNAHIVVESVTGREKKVAIILVDKLTANAVVQRDAEAK